MLLEIAVAYATRHWVSCGLQALSIFVVFLLIRYRFKKEGTQELKLPKRVVARLIKEYAPAPLVEELVEETRLPAPRHNFASYDVFRLGGRFKEEIKQAMREYGMGTCGPRGFYGTLDIHLALEDVLARRFGKAGAVLYSNYFTCLQSVIQCFCLIKNTAYFYRHASEPIVRALYGGKAASVAFETLDELEEKLKAPVKNKYVVVERLCKNTGELLDLERVVALRSRYGFRLILDESHAVPMLYPAPEGDAYRSVDIVVGSLCHGYPGNGGFACGNADVVSFQRLSSNSYVFSASLPGFLTRAALCFVESELDYERLRAAVAMARGVLRNVVSHPLSPLLLVPCRDPWKVQRALAREGFLVGVSGGHIRIGVAVDADEGAVRSLSELIDKHNAGPAAPS